MSGSPDPEIRLLVPVADIDAPELSIVIPARNERIAIGAFVEWCNEGIRHAGIAAEILIVDSSDDDTAHIALDHGARVLTVPPRGLGRAYIDAIPFIRGKYVLMGDADCTYDFREISAFVEQFRAGCEFVMGSRFQGAIEPGSMPPLHRYFGIPLTTWLLNFLYRTRFTDIHCGMRGISRDALLRFNLESQSWEYASEMVLKAVCLKLRIAEVPVRFLKSPAGRLSHMRRRGWTEPWRAGWQNLRALLVYGADFFVLRPGLALLAVGLFLMLGSALGPLRLGPVTLSLYWSLAGLALGIVGIQSFCLGCIVQVIYSYTAESRARWLRLFRYTRAMLCAAAMAAAGAALTLPLISRYITEGYRLRGAFEAQSRMAVLGLFLLTAAFTIGNTTLAIQAAALSGRKRFDPMTGRVLITGGAGCIGSELAARLVAEGAEVVVFDNFSSGKREHIAPLLGRPNFELVEADLLDPAALDRVMPGVSMVYHFAANPDVKFSEGDPTDKDLRQNTLATYNVLESARLHGCRRLAFSSTAAVYGIAERLPIAEDHPCRPISLYGATKLSCEALIGAFHHLFGIEAWIFRLANIAGSKTRRRGRTVIGDFIDALRRDPHHLKILGDGFQAKSYLLDSECVEAMLFAVRHAHAGLNLYNIGGADSLAVRRIADMVTEAMGLRNVEYHFTGGQAGWPGDVPRYTLDVTAINRLGWRARRTSEEAVAIAIRGCLEAPCKP